MILKARFERFKQVVGNDIGNRAKDVQAEIEFVLGSGRCGKCINTL